MMGLDDCLTAFEAAALIGENWEREEPLPLGRHPRPSIRHPRDVGDPTLSQTPSVEESWIPAFAGMTIEGGMTEYHGKQLLQKFGLSIPEGRICAITEAVKTANALGYPVAVKISSATILHKTEMGGVALNLKTAAEVKLAADHMATLGSELLIEKMVQGAVAELIVGLKADPQFGLAMVIGAGGIFTELLKDSVTLLLPTSREEIIRALRKLRVWKLVEGFRGKSGDQEATIAAIQSVAAFAGAYDGQIDELDINPLFVLRNGAIAADALLRMKQ
jgi:acetate---CoA ligase (ADP-forming)